MLVDLLLDLWELLAVQALNNSCQLLVLRLHLAVVLLLRIGLHLNLLVIHLRNCNLSKILNANFPFGLVYFVSSILGLF